MRTFKHAYDAAVTPEALNRLQRFFEEAFESDPDKLSTAHGMLKDLVEGLAPQGGAADKVSPRGLRARDGLCERKLSRDDAAEFENLLGGLMSPQGETAAIAWASTR